MKQTTKTNQFFRLIMTLSRGRFYTSKQLAAELDIDQRTLYRYIEDLKESLFFTFEQRGKAYRLTPDSLFWSNVVDSLFLTDDEALQLQNYLETIETKNRTLLKLRRKVRAKVGNYVAPLDKDADVVIVRNAELLQDAMDKKQMCLLRGYSSLNSKTKTDRLVEPFAFIGNKNEVRCYEVATQMNKTFKVSRCESVEVLDVSWQFQSKHKKMHTDIFHFSDETLTRVRLLMGNTAKTLLLEEYPDAKAYVIPTTDGRWLLDAEFCSMKGVGRFYLGLFDDIEIVDSPEFVEYVKEKLKSLPQL